MAQSSSAESANRGEQDANVLSGPSADDVIRQHITDIFTWLREPDWTDEASMEWLMDWMNRRPIAAVAMVAMLMPNSLSEDRS